MDMTGDVWSRTVEDVIDCYGDMVYRIALSKMGNSSDADDIFQEVFLKYIQKVRQFESEEHRKAWLIRVTINCCKLVWMHPFRKRFAAMEEAPEQSYEMDEEECGIYQEVMKLPANQRLVIELFYYEELSVKEIAACLSISEANVKMRLSRARKRLRLQIDDDGGEQTEVRGKEQE